MLTVSEFQQHTGHKYSEPLYDFLRKIKIHVKTEDQNSILIIFLEVTGKILYALSPDDQVDR